MTAGNFQASLALTLPYEGGYSKHPLDPGGATMCGLTQRVYDAWRDAMGLSRRDVRESTPEERSAIYEHRYWLAARCDGMPAGVDFALFDFAVNSGVWRAVRTLQMLVQTDPDGVPGRYTLAAVQRYQDTHTAGELSSALCRARLAFLQGLSTYAVFGNGWRRRVMGVHEGAQTDDTGVIDHAYAMALQQAPRPTRGPVPTPKTYLAVAA